MTTIATEADIQNVTDAMQFKLDELVDSLVQDGNFYEAEELISAMHRYGYETAEAQESFNLFHQAAKREEEAEAMLENARQEDY